MIRDVKRYIHGDMIVIVSIDLFVFFKKKYIPIFSRDSIKNKRIIKKSTLENLETDGIPANIYSLK